MPLDPSADIESVLYRHPEHARLIGELIAQWSEVEMRLSFFLTLWVDSPIIRPMVYAIESSGARIEAMRAAMLSLEHENTEAQEEINELMDDVKQLLRQRNKYAHSYYRGMRDGTLDMVSLKDHTATKLPLHDIKHQCRAMRRMVLRVQQLIEARLVTRPPEPGEAPVERQDSSGSASARADPLPPGRQKPPGR